MAAPVSWNGQSPNVTHRTSTLISLFSFFLPSFFSFLLPFFQLLQSCFTLLSYWFPSYLFIENNIYFSFSFFISLSLSLSLFFFFLHKIQKPITWSWLLLDITQPCTHKTKCMKLLQSLCSLSFFSLFSWVSFNLAYWFVSVSMSESTQNLILDKVKLCSNYKRQSCKVHWSIWGNICLYVLLQK